MLRRNASSRKPKMSAASKPASEAQNYTFISRLNQMKHIPQLTPGNRNKRQEETRPTSESAVEIQIALIPEIQERWEPEDGGEEPGDGQNEYEHASEPDMPENPTAATTDQGAVALLGCDGDGVVGQGLFSPLLGRDLAH